ncbi:MAG TPA: chemotaxis protein CheW [Coriobacteriia bacterium]
MARRKTASSPAAVDAAVLHRRALALAARAEESDHSADLQVLEFSVGDETYALETRFVSEVYPVTDLALIPGTPDFVLGVISVRGKIVSVLDLRPIFGLRVREGVCSDTAIVLRSDSMEFGVAADQIREVKALPLETLQQSLKTLAGASGDYVFGVTPERVVLLDAAKLLADPRLVVRPGAGSEALTTEGSA